MMDQQGQPVKTLTEKFVPVPFALVEAIPELGMLPVCVYLVIAKHRDKDTNEAFPSQKTIAEMCGVTTDRAVRNALRILEAAGFLESSNQQTDSGRELMARKRTRSNLYRILGLNGSSKPERRFRAERRFRRDRNVGSGSDRNVDSGGTRNVDSAEQEPVRNKNQANKNQGNKNAARAPTKAHRKRFPAFSADDFDQLVWPASLDTDTGRESLRAWLRYKADRSQAYKGTAGPQALLNKFGNGTDDDFQAAVEHSIACNYAGCFSPNGKGTKNATGHRDDDPRGNIATVQRYIEGIEGSDGEH